MTDRGPDTPADDEHRPADQPPGARRRDADLATGIAIGLVLGAGIGVALGNLAIGMGVGIALGVALGVARSGGQR